MLFFLISPLKNLLLLLLASGINLLIFFHYNYAANGIFYRLSILLLQLMIYLFLFQVYENVRNKANYEMHSSKSHSRSRIKTLENYIRKAVFFFKAAGNGPQTLMQKNASQIVCHRFQEQTLLLPLHSSSFKHHLMNFKDKKFIGKVERVYITFLFLKW